MIESGDAGFGPYAMLPQPAMAVLSDLRAVAIRILSDLPLGDLPKWSRKTTPATPRSRRWPEST
jgi:hypothetical protein